MNALMNLHLLKYPACVKQEEPKEFSLTLSKAGMIRKSAQEIFFRVPLPQEQLPVTFSIFFFFSTTAAASVVYLKSLHGARILVGGEDE